MSNNPALTSIALLSTLRVSLPHNLIGEPMGPLLILLILAVALVRMGDHEVQRPGHAAQPGGKTLETDRCPAQTATRPYPRISSILSRAPWSSKQETLQKVIAARGAAVSGDRSGGCGAKEGVLSGRPRAALRARRELPSLKSNENVKQLQEELSVRRTRSVLRGQFYNDIATKFNIALQVFPEIRGAALRLQAIGALRDQKTRESATFSAGRSFSEEIVRFPVPDTHANIFEQQAANRRNTILVMAVFVLFVGSWVSGSTCSSSVSLTGGALFPAFR